MVDISIPSSIALPTPQDAAQNILGSKAFDVHPDSFADIGDLLKPDLNAAMSTNDATPTVAKYAAQSTQHLALIKGDGPPIARVASADEPQDPVMIADDPTKHSYTERQMNFIGAQLKHGIFGNQDSTNQTMDKILFDSKNWNDDKELALQVSLMKDAQDQPSTQGLSSWEQVPGHAIGSLGSILSDVWNNKSVFAASVAAGTAAGGPAGAILGVDVGFAYSTFKNTSASVYNSLPDVDESTRRYAALGAGTVSAIVQAGAGAWLAKGLPGVGDKITSSAVKAMMNDPAQTVIKKSIISLGKAVQSMAIMGGASSIQSAIQTFATSFAKDYNGKPESFSNALAKATSEVAANSSDIVRAGTEGALGAGIAHGAFGAVSKVLPTPEVPSIESGKFKLPEGNAERQAILAMNVGQTLDQINKIGSSTKLAEHAPEELVTLQKSLADNAGVKNVFIDPSDLQTWGERGGRAAAARSWFGGKGLLNEPAAVPIHSYLGLAREFPDIMEHVRAIPDGPSVAESREILKSKSTAEVPNTPFESSEKVLDPQAEIAKNNNAVSIENPNLQIADRFNGQEGIKGNKTHEKSGFSDIAIDPRSLSEDQKGFLKDFQLKEHGVFVKGGMSADHTAALLGFTDTDTMLKTLQDTPTREQVNEAAVKQQSEVKVNAEPTIAPEETLSAKQLSQNTKAHLEEMKSLKKIETPTAKGEPPIKIELPIPKFSDIANEAKVKIGETKLGDLNTLVHQVGERKSTAMADEAKTKGEILNAFQAREAAAKNSELIKRSQIATAQVNKVIQLATKFTPDVMEQLKGKGKEYFDAAHEILSKLNLAQTADKVKDGALEKFVDEKSQEGGIVGPVLNPEIFPKSFNDLTVNQTLAIGNSLRSIIKASEMKDAFYKTPELSIADKTYEGAVNEALRLATEHPLYDKNKALPNIKSNEGKWSKMSRYFSDDTTTIRSEQSLWAEMDRGTPGGFWYKLLFAPKDNARNIENEYKAATSEQNRKIINDYGKKEFNNLANKKVFVPEFKGIYGLGDGKGNITKEALIALGLNTGNEGNWTAVDRFGVDRETMAQVLERELSQKDRLLIQNFHNVFKSFYDKVQALQLRTEGTEFVPVEGEYYPLHYLNDDVARMGKQLVGSSEFNKLRQNMTAQALTEQGHLIERERSNQLLDLDLNRYGHSLNQIHHDLAYREAVADTAKLLADPRIADAIAGVVGKGALELAKNNLVDVAGKVDREGYNKSAKLLENIVTNVSAGTRIVNIGLKLSSALKAFSVLPQLRATMSRDEAHVGAAEKHLTMTAAKLFFRPDLTLTGPAMDFAREIDPSIRNMGEEILGRTSNELVDMMPKRGNVTDPLVTGAKVSERLGLLSVSASHQLVKAFSALATYSQAFSGDVKGVVAGDHEAALNYARGVSATTQSHYETDYLSNIQKTKYVRQALAYYFTDANQANNNNMLQYRLAKAKFAEPGIVPKLQGIGGLTNHITSVVTARAMLLALTGVGSKALIDTMFGNGDQRENDKDISEDLAQKTMEEIGGTYPLAREAIHAYSYQSGRGGYQFQTPLIQTTNNLLTGGAGLIKALGLWGEDEVSQTEAKAMLASFGYVTHLPTDSLYKFFGSPDLLDLPSVNVPEMKTIGDAISTFITKNNAKPPTQQIDEKFMAQLEALKTKYDAPVKAQIPPGAVPIPKNKSGLLVPREYYDTLFSAENPEKNPTLKNSKSSATGIVQFTQPTWDDLRKSHPELHLPETVAEASPAQQIRAGSVFTESNARKITAAGKPITFENLYATHLLGADGGIRFLKAPDNMRVFNVVGTKALRDNWRALGAKSKVDTSVTVGQAKQGIARYLGLTTKTNQ